MSDSMGVMKRFSQYSEEDKTALRQLQDEIEKKYGFRPNKAHMIQAVEPDMPITDELANLKQKAA